VTSPSLELQGAIVERLKAYPALASLVGSRVYDHVPPDVVFPYVSWGPEQTVSDDSDCITAFEISIQLDAWSRTVGLSEVKRIAEAVRAALHDHDLVLTENALVSIQHRQTRNLRDPDGQTMHAVIDLVALIEQPQP
jgi:hypothetical protein